MSIRYTEKPYGGHGSRAADPWSRFPANAQPMQSAPTAASPIKLFENDGRARYGVHHLGSWREVERVRDARTGGFAIRMNGSVINPVAWASS
jgi:hypothetical protein